MTKFVFVHLFNDRSGSPKVLSQVIRAISQSGRTVEVITSGHADGFLTGLPGTRRKLFYRRSENKFLTLFFYLIAQVVLFLTCLRYWRQDVSFYVNTMMPFGAAFAAKLMRKPVVYHVHETSLRPALFKRFLRLAIELTASKVVFVSDYLRRTEGFEKKRQYVIYNALETHFTPIVAKPQSPLFTVLMICSMKKYKGIFEFFELAKLLIPQSSVRFTLVLNALQSEIDTYLNGIVIPANIDIFPRQIDVRKFYTEASLLLSLSRPDEWIETFGLTILEGMAYGLPVVVPPIGGPAEIVTDGQEGFLIPCYELQTISNVILQFSSDPELHSQFAHNAQMRANDFRLTIFEKNIVNLLES